VPQIEGITTLNIATQLDDQFDKVSQIISTSWRPSSWTRYYDSRPGNRDLETFIVCAGDTRTRLYPATTAMATVTQFLLLGRLPMASCQDDTTEISGWSDVMSLLMT
jgi:hypothetical protein